MLDGLTPNILDYEGNILKPLPPSHRWSNTTMVLVGSLVGNVGVLGVYLGSV